MNLSQLFIGFSSGLIAGIAVFLHALSRATVLGSMAGIGIGAIAIEGGRHGR